MDTDGTRGHDQGQGHGTYGGPPDAAVAGPQVPRPAGPPPMPPRPPVAPPGPPAHAPGVGNGAGAAAPPSAGSQFVAWLRTPRPAAEPGIWRFAYQPVLPKPVGADRAVLTRVVIAFLVYFVCWQLFLDGNLPFLGSPLYFFTPDAWWTGDLTPAPKDHRGMAALELYELLVTVGMFLGFAKVGGWRAAFDRLIADRGPWYRALGAAVGAFVVVLLIDSETLSVYPLAFGHLPYAELGSTASTVVTYLLYALIYLPVLLVFARLGGWAPLLAGLFAPAGPPAAEVPTVVPGSPQDPVGWPQLRAAGLGEAADRLAAEAEAGRMNDVDLARIRRAWASVRADPSRGTAFASAVRDKGAGACGHPSGARDLPARTARHDLAVAQVRLGRVADTAPNPDERRGTAMALDPGVLGTSLLAVGPSGAGKTSLLIRPVVESLALQALAGEAALIAVGGVGARLGPDEAYDIVVRPGDPASVHDLDLYGGTADPDEAASLLAEAFVGDLPGLDVRRAATALAQLLGPFRAAYGRFPAVPELRALLDLLPAAVGALRQELEATGQQSMLRELDARARHHGGHGDPGAALADRVALLDRPAFHGFFDTSGTGRPFSLRALEHPVRVRVDLPERGHPDASRLLARLLLAQFTASAAARTDRSLFAFLALDDASHTLTPEAVRGVQRLRSANAGVLLALRSLDDVPEALRTPLLGAVGCRMAFSGVTTWDGKWFADAWGTELVETRDVTSRAVYADRPFTRVVHMVRKLITGKAVSTDAVTVRQVERERWSASALANTVPPGHAVLSLTSVRGEQVAPLLLRLAGTS
ncbi:ATP/GTP-binding protein [Streptomyces sp. NBC_00249]|uniref:ATP/GTP-binding protein n=1 Tax=Streptomyces sp. NBC_00249 TaxID=2975690 RepID=UPI0022584FC8|nr:ATP/GTP-binding protein [Streptomyces sp. NBC_00249]MCX5194042.1 ATP/GTP-binding protein [Streptomyces sp. NBC_00249]